MIEAERNRELMTGPRFRRDAVLSHALDIEKLARRAVWHGHAGPIGVMLQETGPR